MISLLNGLAQCVHVSVGYNKRVRQIGAVVELIPCRGAEKDINHAGKMFVVSLTQLKRSSRCAGMVPEALNQCSLFD